jgi:hypothetical protein
MKKYLVFIFTLFYFTVASGTTLEFHHCMGKLVEWGMSEPSESKICDNCKMSAEDSENCCKKDQHDVKIEKAQKTQFNYEFKQLASPVTQAFAANFALDAVQRTVVTGNLFHGPPRTEKTPVFLLLRTFRI